MTYLCLVCRSTPATLLYNGLSLCLSCYKRLDIARLPAVKPHTVNYKGYQKRMMNNWRRD